MNISQISQKVFARLGREKQLREYHDIIYKLLGIVIDFANAEGKSLRLSTLQHFNPFCAKLRSSPGGNESCRQCDWAGSRSARLTGESSIYRCHAGLTDIVVPLFDRNGNYIGGITSGQFLREGDTPASPEEITETAVKHGLDPEELDRLYRRTRVLSDIQVQGLREYLQVIGQIITNTHNNLVFLETIDSPDKIALIKQYVEDHYMTPLNVPETARRFYLSSGHFSHFFRREVGVSFMNYVNMYRISKTEEFLRQTECRISEIASLCGFGSISQFNRVFRNITGRSPREFRSPDVKPE